MNDLNEKILQWASDKGILAKGTPDGQLAKTIEELIETAQAVALYDLIAESYHFDDEDANERLEHVKDGIGDVYVTLVIHAKLKGYEIPEAGANEDDYTNKELFNDFGSGISQLHKTSWDCAYIPLVSILHKLARNHCLTLRECVEHSYNVIYKRTGEMIDGVFVRDN